MGVVLGLNEREGIRRDVRNIVLSNVNQLGFKLHHKARLKMPLLASPLWNAFLGIPPRATRSTLAVQWLDLLREGRGRIVCIQELRVN